jgi:oligoendopeptidase F
MSHDRDLRKASFEAFYTRFAEFKNTWTAMYDGEVKARIFESKARKYNSCFEAAVDGNNVSPLVCDSLFESIHGNMDKMHRYVSLRKKLLGVDELHMYDVYVSMIPDFDMNVTYDEAKEISLKALAPLGEDYLAVVKEAYENRWIDVVENEGKRSGAYSSNVYGTHPYMLLNYNDTLNDVFTLVHEMGHSMHSWYSSKAQHILDAGYKIFVAEVASTTNEVLLYHYLKDHAKSKEEKAFIVNHFLESFKSTMFRQTMFEEFERKTCKMAEDGEPLTAESLYNVYYNLNKEYFGEDMISDELIGWEWCRIPHFYYNFYVYQYATSFAAAVAIADRILKEGAPAVEQYKKFLSSGCTQDPVSLLKIAGVDLTTKAPIDAALKVFGEALDEMEEIMK